MVTIRVLRGVPWKLCEDKVHIVHAFETESKLCLAQVRVADKSNEITAVPELLKAINIEGAVITSDALITQKEITQQIVESKGDYFMALKANHPTLYDEAKLYFSVTHEGQYSWRILEKNRGYVEERTCTVSGNTVGWELLDQWQGLTVIVRISSVRWIDGKESREERYYLTSKISSGKHYLHISRSHWSVENLLHRTLDVSFLEDACQIHDKNAATNVSVMRKLAISLLRQALPERSLVSKRKKAAYDPEFRRDLLEGKI